MIDRLCIIQDQPEDLLWQQLNQIASLYQRAALTLIAAAGSNAHAGLPGVSEPRVRQDM